MRTLKGYLLSHSRLYKLARRLVVYSGCWDSTNSGRSTGILLDSQTARSVVPQLDLAILDRQDPEVESEVAQCSNQPGSPCCKQTLSNRSELNHLIWYMRQMSYYLFRLRWP